MSFYTGGESSYNFLKYKTNQKSLKMKKPGLSAFVGTKINKHFGTEIGYNKILKAKGTNNTYFDVLGYISVNKNVDLIAAGGMGHMRSKINIANDILNDKPNKSKIGPRLGCGIQYKINENFATRLVVRYQKGNKKYFNSNSSINLGLIYNF